MADSESARLGSNPSPGALKAMSQSKEGNSDAQPVLKWAPAVILLLHIFVSLHAARQLSPTWDEIAYPAAGLAQLTTGKLNLNTVNPYLAKVFYALPLLFTDSELPLSHPSWENAEEYRFGFLFTYRNHVDPQRLIFLSRLPLVVFSSLTAFFFYLWSRSLWGPVGGLLSLLSLLSTPIFLSRASVAQLEMPMFAFLTVALWGHARWLETNRRGLLVLSGVSFGLSLLSKFVALPFLPAAVLLNLFFHKKKPPMAQRFISILILTGIAGAVVLVAYLPWMGGWAALKKAISNVVTFDTILPYYWAGRTFERAPSLISWAAFFVKAPLHILVLAGWGAWVWKKSKQHGSTFGTLGFFTLASLGSVLFFSNAVSTIQLSPAYLGFAGMIGALAYLWNNKPVYKWLILGVLTFGAVDVYAVHPNYLAYFNRVVGGPTHGYRWLADSDQDWGQSLPALAVYLRKDKGVYPILCYSGSGDPAAYGIVYQDLLSPALVTRERSDNLIPADAEKVLLVVGTKVIQSEPALAWLHDNRSPSEIVGETFLVYDVSGDAAACKWMGEIYRQTNRPWHAKRMGEHAQRIASRLP